MLNHHFSRLVPLLERHGGDVHELIGDAIMAVFNKSGGQADHARLAAETGLELQRVAEELAAQEPQWPRFRVGVNSGEVVVGEGTYRRLPSGTRVERLPELHVRGKAQPVTAYALRALPAD